MSLAEDLLNGIATVSDNVETEPHIVIGADRVMVVPEELKRIAVQYDHMIETVTFDCPRYWDNHDMSKMKIYVNYMREDGEKGSDLCTNVTIDEADENLMHFDWTVTGHLSAIYGPIVFLVCIQKVASDGTSANHWNSELCKDLFVSEGLEVESFVASVYPGIITALLTRMDDVEAKTTDESLSGYVKDFIEGKPEMMQDLVDTYMNKNGDEYVTEYLSTNPDGVKTIQESVNKYLSDNVDFIEDDVTVLACDISYVDCTFRITSDLHIGDGFGGSQYVTAYEGYYIHSQNVSAGHYIDFTESDYIPSGISVGSSYYCSDMIVTDMSGTIIDLVPYTDLAASKHYICKEDCKIYITSAYEYTMSEDAVLFKIKKYIDFSNLNSNVVTSPNGTTFKIIVDDNGLLSTIPV